MNISSRDIIRTLNLSEFRHPRSVCSLNPLIINLTKRETLQVARQCKVVPFVFQKNNRFWGGVVTNFIIEATEKSTDPFAIEDETQQVVEKIKDKSGFINAKIYNPLPDSERIVEALPCGVGDCFILAL